MFRTNRKRRNESGQLPSLLWYFFLKYHSEILQQLRGTLTTVFEMTPYSWRFYRHQSTYELTLFSVNIFQRKSTKVPGKLSFTQQSEPAIRRIFHRDISLIIDCMFLFSQINQVALFRYFDYDLFTFFYFLIFCVSWS